MAVQFVIDSGSDILPQEAKAQGIVHLPLKVLFGETEYLDAVDFSHREFYEKLVGSDQIPTTCQVPPAEFEAAYERIVAAGDAAVVVTVSGKLSGTYQSAVIAAEDYAGKVFVVDSENVSLGQRILVQQGLRYRAAGLSAAEIAARLEEEGLEASGVVVYLEYPPIPGSEEALLEKFRLLESRGIPLMLELPQGLEAPLLTGWFFKKRMRDEALLIFLEDYAQEGWPLEW